MMTESVQGKTRAAAAALCEQFHHLVTGKSPATAVAAALGDLKEAVRWCAGGQRLIGRHVGVG